LLHERHMSVEAAGSPLEASQDCGGVRCGVRGVGVGGKKESEDEDERPMLLGAAARPKPRTCRLTGLPPSCPPSHSDHEGERIAGASPSSGCRAKPSSMGGEEEEEEVEDSDVEDEVEDVEAAEARRSADAIWGQI
jgi:hypothetical protein